MAEQSSIGQPRHASRDVRSALFRYRLLLCLAYPPLVTLAVVGDASWVKVLLLPLAVTIVLLPMLAGGRRLAWGVLAGVTAFAAVALSHPWLGMWPPIGITAGMAAWFGLSLRPRSIPLIARFARAVLQARDMPPPDTESPHLWMWSWTLIWALCLGSGAAALAWFAISGDATLWMWASFALPVLAGTLLYAEHGLRRLFLPEHARMTFLGFITALISVQWNDLSS